MHTNNASSYICSLKSNTTKSELNNLAKLLMNFTVFLCILQTIIFFYGPAKRLLLPQEKPVKNKN